MNQTRVHSSKSGAKSVRFNDMGEVIELKTKQLRGISEDYVWQHFPLDTTPGAAHKNGTKNGYSSATMKRRKNQIDIRDGGLHIWRVKDKYLNHWPKEEYGHLYSEDCYIVLQMHRLNLKDDAMFFNLHMWAGKNTSIEDYKGAMFHMNRLDGMNQNSLLHREVEANESTSFKSYFNPVTYWRGGSDLSYLSPHTTFKQSYPVRLLKFFRPDPTKNKHKVQQVTADASQLNNSFVYILDRGMELYQWNGSLCQSEDVLKALEYTQSLKVVRGGHVRVKVMNEKDHDEKEEVAFYTFLTRRKQTLLLDDDQNNSTFPSMAPRMPFGAQATLIRIVIHKGKRQFKKVKEGKITEKDLDKQGMCIVTIAGDCYVWFSRKTADEYRSAALAFAHEYLRETPMPLAPVTVLTEGQRFAPFERILSSR